MDAQTKNDLRLLLAIALTLVALWMGYVTLTAPLIATGGPAVLAVAAAVGAFFAWRGWEKPLAAPEQ